MDLSPQVTRLQNKVSAMMAENGVLRTENTFYNSLYCSEVGTSEVGVPLSLSELDEMDGAESIEHRVVRTPWMRTG